MHSLNTKTTQFNIVISLKDKKDINSFIFRLKDFLDKYVCTYAYILHDKDIDSNGVLKTPHIHLVIFNTQRKRLSTIINEISSMLNINPFAITIEKVVSLEGCIQYLIHKNDLEKYRYDIIDIITNMSKDDLSLYIDSENGSLTFDRLFYIIRHAKNKTEVIETIGLSYYRAYRAVITDIWNDYKG